MRASRIYTPEELAFMQRLQRRLEHELRLTTSYERDELAGILLSATDLQTSEPESICRAIAERYARAEPLSGPLFSR